MNKWIDVFPTLKMEKNLYDLFWETEVEKIVTTSDKTSLKIFIKSTHLIPKKSVTRMEMLIQNQLFANGLVNVRIHESFHLSNQYTPEHLLKEYEESILYELKNRSIVEYTIFKNAVPRFENETILCLEIEDTVIAQGKKEQVVQYLEEIFTVRCKMPIEVRIVYCEKKKSRMSETNELQMQLEVAAIAEQKAQLNAQKEDDRSDTKDKEAKETKEKKAVEKKNNQKYYRKSYKSNDSNLIYGRDFFEEEEEPIVLSQVTGEMGEIVFRGKVIKKDVREIRGEKSILIFTVTDFTDSIVVKMFVKNEQLPSILAEIKEGAFLKIKGVSTIDRYDGELSIGSLTTVKKIADFTKKRQDVSLEKRVELHAHTKMSDMDGVVETKELVERAHEWGHKAIAITDHGVVQAFPDANHCMHKFGKSDPFKVIYGMEAYVVDDLKEITVNAKAQNMDDEFVIFDIETTGFSPVKDQIIEIGAVKYKSGEVIERYSVFVNPQRPIPYKITQLTGITDEMVEDAKKIDDILPAFIEFVGNAVLVAHNASFDVSFINQKSKERKIETDFTYIDTVAMARVFLPTLSAYRLDVVAKALHISLENHHRAVDDAEATAHIFAKLLNMAKEAGADTLEKMNEMSEIGIAAMQKMVRFHVTILAQNDIGRVNLYTLVSLSHLKYLRRVPIIPKSELNKYREGLLLGSGCNNGELFRSAMDDRGEEALSEIARYYDFLEVQPVSNYEYMVESPRAESITSLRDLQKINERIVKLGEALKKPVVATGDVHFLEPEDEVYRRIILAGKKPPILGEQPPLYFRTTQEMLEEFQHLGSDKAKEIVITNTNVVADMIEKISPVRPDKCPPIIEDSDKTLRNICYEKANATYGESLPKVVVDRLERELNSIISNGFAVMYIIAQKLVWKSLEDGYLVGSRGSVGSSFVATMAGITEVNPLSPHYYCMGCHYSEFDSEEVKKYAGGCGWDLPDKACPNCGEMLIKDGFDIPFETFLGFKGNKEPDIDLNFSGEYQSHAHKYTETIFGEGQTFRAGTISTLADKTAYGYVKGYYDENEIRKRRCEIERIAQGCTKIRRSTGQHPGGIIVLPHGENIHSFTPIQHPANDMETDIVTTHFDYHSIDHNLLKLDILGHDDPTMIRMLEDLTGINATKIKLDDKEVMRLFASTEVLGVKSDDIGGCPVGCLGIPEFGTDFVIQMVVDTRPQTLSDLIRISGLSHGTDVWLNNAQTLIKEGKATISTAICTRDDIMTYLINMGMESELSFDIMESVRKGKGLKPDWEEAMKNANVPEWYIGSCKTIQYMFPKAHAAAYVMMAYRIAYFKINYPLAYYAAYFSIRASAFSYELMCMGRERVEYYIKDYKKRSDQLTKKEQDTLKDLRIVQEMLARGYAFMKMDIYRAKADRFQIIDGKLMPPLSSVEGLGDKAADTFEEAAKQGAFLSKDDIKQRGKVSKTVVDLMADLGIIENLPESNQISLFDSMM